MPDGYDAFSGESNPYHATNSDALTVHESDNEPEAIRRSHINYEAAIKSIGTLLWLGSIGFFTAGVGGVIAFWVLLGGQASPRDQMLVYARSAFFVIVAALQAYVAFGVWRLNPWTRWIIVSLCGLGLLSFPAGTIVCGYLLYLVLCKKGTMIFSKRYAEIIEMTPHVKHKTSVIVWIVVLLLIAGTLAVVSAYHFRGTTGLR